jgi:hypothetical protein
MANNGQAVARIPSARNRRALIHAVNLNSRRLRFERLYILGRIRNSLKNQVVKAQLLAGGESRSSSQSVYFEIIYIIRRAAL